MKVKNAIMYVNNIPPENTFIAIDGQGNETGMGQITYQMMPHAFPDVPVNLYFNISAISEARYVLLGALASRARILRETGKEYGARFYTAIDARDEAAKAFYQKNGMTCSDTENLLQLTPPTMPVRLFMGMSVMEVPLNTEEEIHSFCNRMNEHDIYTITPQTLRELRAYPHFRALGLCLNNGTTLAGEMIIAGSGTDCELMAIYIYPNFRRKHFALNFVQYVMSEMGRAGVTQWFGKFNSRSKPQKGLARSLQPHSVEVLRIFPCMTL